jgi:potassium-dependent mechanosensitive channel
MSNPWLEWWEQTQLRFGLITVRSMQVQLVALALALMAALVLDRLLERNRERWVGDSRLRAIIWAAKFPLLALGYGYVVLTIFSATGRASYTLGQLVSLFWYITAYTLLARAVSLAMPRGQSQRFIHRVLMPALAVLSILHILGLLEVLHDWASQWVISVGTSSVDGASLAVAIGALILFWLVARLSRGLLLYAMLPRTETDPQLARSASDFVQFAVIIAGLWIALSLLGLELSNLTLVVSALTVGIGFGLQDVIKNLVGGLILLSERHVRPNEVFQISGQMGIVERIGLRSTLLRCMDGTRVIIPNADLIVEKISDLSNVRRVEIKVGVSTEADPRRVERLLLDLAESYPDVVAEPAPSVLFQSFGESTHDFVLYCFVSDRAQVVPTASALRYALVEAFDKHQIDMPYPQLSVHVRQDGQPGPGSR